MRRMGYDQNAINAEKARANVTSSQNQGTAYDAGYTTGVNSQNATYNAAGQDYGQISQPTAGLATAYSNLNTANTNAQKGWGNAIDQATGLVDSTTKTPSSKTASGTLSN